MLGKCPATYGVWSAMKVQSTVYICKNSMVEKYIFVGKPILHFVYTERNFGFHEQKFFC